jgi:hypothetical protein
MTIPARPAASFPAHRWFAALAAVAAAAAHVAPTPEHLEEVPYIGWLFVALTVVCLAGAAGIVATRSRAAWVLSAGACALAVVAYAASRTVGLPGMTDDIGNWFEPLAVVSVVSETVVAVLGGWVLATGRWRD